MARKRIARASTPVHLAGPDGVRVSTTLGALLPMAFDTGAFGREPA